MRTTLIAFLAVLFMVVVPAVAQTTINGSRIIIGDWDASGANSTQPVKVGASLPGTCTTGEMFWDSDEVPGSRLYGCISTNVWRRIGYKIGTTCGATCTLGETCFDTDATAGENWYGCTATDTWTALGGSVTGGDGIAVAGSTVSVDLIDDGDAQSATSASESGLEFVAGELGLVRGCADDYILKWNETNGDWNCEVDVSAGSPTFNTIGSGTNTTAAMVVGNGASIELEEGGEVEANEVIIFAQNETGATIYKCTAVHVHDFDIPSALPEIVIADADNTAVMPAIGITYENIANGASGRVLLAGTLTTADTSSATGGTWAEGDRIYVDDSGTSASTECGDNMTKTRPANVDDAVQAIGTVTYVNAAVGKLVVSGAGRANDVPNLQSAYIRVGNASNISTAVQMSADATMDNAGAVTVANDSHAHTTTTLSGIAVGDLADATDGELITWAADGTADTVAVGTATHVLTSNGVGAAPTFQAAAGGGGGNVTTSQATAPTCNIGDKWIETDADYIQWNGVADSAGSCIWWLDYTASHYVTYMYAAGPAWPVGLSTSGTKAYGFVGGQLVAKIVTDASSGADAIAIRSTTALTSSDNNDPDAIISIRGTVDKNYTTTGRFIFGAFSSATNADFSTLDEGIYFLCAPGDDVDGDGTPGSTNDDYWWTVTQDGDTDTSGDICATLTGAQCATYTAVNTTATNTEIGCAGVGANPITYEIRKDPDNSEVRFYMDLVLVATHTTNIIGGVDADKQATLLGMWAEASTTTSLNYYMNYMAITIDRRAF